LQVEVEQITFAPVNKAEAPLNKTPEISAENLKILRLKRLLSPMILRHCGSGSIKDDLASK